MMARLALPTLYALTAILVASAGISHGCGSLVDWLGVTLPVGFGIVVAAGLHVALGGPLGRVAPIGLLLLTAKVAILLHFWDLFAFAVAIPPYPLAWICPIYLIVGAVMFVTISILNEGRELAVEDLCRHCHYPRLLAQTRCPECGAEYDVPPRIP